MRRSLNIQFFVEVEGTLRMPLKLFSNKPLVVYTGTCLSFICKSTPFFSILSSPSSGSCQEKGLQTGCFHTKVLFQFETVGSAPSEGAHGCTSKCLHRKKNSLKAVSMSLFSYSSTGTSYREFLQQLLRVRRWCTSSDKQRRVWASLFRCHFSTIVRFKIIDHLLTVNQL